MLPITVVSLGIQSAIRGAGQTHTQAVFFLSFFLHFHSNSSYFTDFGLTKTAKFYWARGSSRSVTNVRQSEPRMNYYHSNVRYKSISSVRNITVYLTADKGK